MIKYACIIEDDPISSTIAKKMVQKFPAIERTEIFENGKQAYQTLKSNLESGIELPDLILLDIFMPVWDGWDFLEEFKKLPIQKEISIYILTSSTGQDDLEQAKKYGLEKKYLIKPLKMETLEEILH